MHNQLLLQAFICLHILCECLERFLYLDTHILFACMHDACFWHFCNSCMQQTKNNYIKKTSITSCTFCKRLYNDGMLNNERWLKQTHKYKTHEN